MTNRTSASSTNSTYLKTKHKRRQTWTCQPRHQTSLNVFRWNSLHQKKRQRISKKITPYESYARRTTISTFTNSTEYYSFSEKSTLVDQPIQRPSILNAQSLLFLFGFLFFPCWWIGGYYLKKPCEEDEEQRWVTVHPSLLANGQTSSKILWLANIQSVKRQEIDELLLFYRWNRLMSLVSIGFLVLISGLFIWYFVKYN